MVSVGIFCFNLFQYMIGQITEFDYCSRIPLCLMTFRRCIVSVAVFPIKQVVTLKSKEISVSFKIFVFQKVNFLNQFQNSFVRYFVYVLKMTFKRKCASFLLTELTIVLAGVIQFIISFLDSYIRHAFIFGFNIL